MGFRELLVSLSFCYTINCKIISYSDSDNGFQSVSDSGRFGCPGERPHTCACTRFLFLWVFLFLCLQGHTLLYWSGLNGDDGGLTHSWTCTSIFKHNSIII